MRLVGVLGAVAALLAAYLLFFDHDPREGAPAGVAGVPLVARFDRGSVQRVTVARAGQPPYALVREAGGSGWWIEPDHLPADASAVGDLLAAVEQAETDRTADLSPAAAGLTPPRVTLSLDGAAGGVQLRLGNPDGAASGVFVQAGAGGAVRVAPRRLLQLADRPASALQERPAPATDGGAARPAPPPRSARVLDFAHFDVRELRRVTARRTLEAHSADGETWTSQPPVDAAAMARLIAALGNLQAAEWLAGPPAGRSDLVLEVAVQAPGDPAAVRHRVEVWPDCAAQMQNAGAFRVAQNLCDDLRLDPASPSRR